MDKFTEKYRDFLRESLDKNFKLSDKHKQLKEDILKLIEQNINSDDIKIAKDYITNYINNSEEVKLTGLLDLHDIFNFYLKNKIDIDEVLKENNYFTKPIENATGLYDMVIIGTKDAVKLAMKMLLDEVTGNFAQV